MEEIKLYTSHDVAEMLGTTPRTVWTYIKDGRLKARKVGRAWKITADSLKAFLDDGQTGKENALKEIREVQADTNETRVNFDEGTITIYYADLKGLSQGRVQAQKWLQYWDRGQTKDK